MDIKNKLIGLPKRIKYLILIGISFIILNIIIFKNNSKILGAIPASTHTHYSTSGDFSIITKPKDANDKFMDDLINDEDHSNLNIHIINASEDENTEGVREIEKDLSKYAIFQNFLTDYFRIIDLSKPKIGPLNNDNHYKENQRVPVYGGHLRENRLDEPVRTKAYLSSFLQLSTQEIDALKESHDYITNHLPSSFPDGLFKGDGIVYVGGGKYDWLVLLSIKTLRSTGSTLPIEIIIPNDSEYNIDLCNRVFPIMNAKCILMSDYLPTHIKIDGFQLKAFALIISSFENILYLDSDNLPLKNPDILFINKPFINHGLISWPDFWRRSTSPLLYKICNIKINESNHLRNSYQDERDLFENLEQLSYHDFEGTLPESSSETGQLLINKKTHAQTLLLSLYYNVYGPNFYYPLFSQGAAGEGDKETFIASAHKLQLPYYQVNEFIREFGSLNDNGDHEILGMGQYDPIIDYIQLNTNETSNEYSSKLKNNYNYHYFKHSTLMFIHANWPKLNPIELSSGTGLRKVKNDDGERHRLYGDIYNELGYDFELGVWEDMKWIVCDNHEIKIKGIDNKIACGEVKEQIVYLKKSSKFA